MAVEIICLAILMILLFVKYKTSRYPPGPLPWPFIGNLTLMVSARLHEVLTKLSKTYGDVFTIYLGPRPMVVLSGSAIKEALVEQSVAFAGRPSRKDIIPQCEDKRAYTLFMMPYGDAWRLFRKLGHQTIKVYGQDRLQNVMDIEVDDLCKRLKNSQGKQLDIYREFAISVTNVICHQIFGKRYDFNDPELLKVFEVNDLLVHTPIGRCILESIPVVKHILPVSDDAQKRDEALKWMDRLLNRIYKEHVATFDAENIRDYTDALIKAKLDAEKEDSSSRQYLTKEAVIVAGLNTMFLAGSETTSTTLTWAVRFLLHYPAVQGRLHQEIDDVLGPNDDPKLDHKKHLPLLEAFITETLRMSSILPLDIPHQTTADATVRGFTIPKGTTVIPNLWALHYDPTLWPEPHKFSLDRHLDNDGKFVSPANGTFYPFSAGRRVCIGEVFARSELFLFLATLLQKFRFENPRGSELPSLDCGDGVVSVTKSFDVCVIVQSFYG